jgi:hypothetical protein
MMHHAWTLLAGRGRVKWTENSMHAEEARA